MPIRTHWRRWGRAAALLLVSAAAVWCAFVAATPVPLLDWFDLGVHETGHLLTAFAPEIVMFMAGSFSQIAVPLALAWYFGIHRRDPAAGGLCLAWAGTSTWDVSVYAADAVTQQLPLIGGGQHDWATILSHFDALHLTGPIARSIEAVGLVMAVAGLMLIATRLVPTRAPVAAPQPAAPVDDDPWMAAGRLPFRHEPASR